jgi:ferredoxin-NADP reductase
VRRRPRPGPGIRPPLPVAGERQRLRPGTVLFVVAAGALGVLWLWWRNTESISGPGDWITNAGRIAGLLAGYGAAALLALMSRLPALEHGVGTDRLTRWHAVGGRYVVGLLVAHALLIVWGYAVTAHTSIGHQASLLLTSYPDVLMATVALGLFVLVGVSSARAARRRLRYETWHFVHLYTYLAVALAFAHQFATGAEFIDDGTARWAWSALYLAVVALLLRHRVVAPVVSALRHRLRVVSVRPEGRDVVSVYISGRRLGELATEAGQFFRWRFLTRDLWWAANPYSLSAPPDGDILRVTVKVAGQHSAALRALKPGTRVFAEGPYGSFTAALRQGRKVALIAGGVGITPLRALFETLPAGPGELTLLSRARSMDEVLFRRELERIARLRGARVLYLLGRSDEGADVQLSAGHLRLLLPDLREHDVYLCGPPGMTALARAAAREAGVARRRIHEESFVF